MMKQKILIVLCEGQTEEYFVKHTLRKYLSAFDVSVTPHLLVTNRSKNARGGLTSYQQVRNDLDMLNKTKRDNDYQQFFFTTMFDYYQLATDFPGYSEFSQRSNHAQHVEFIEQKMQEDLRSITDRTIIPYIQLHEFEALVFAGLDFLPSLYTKNIDKALTSLKDGLRKANDNPEAVNDNVNTAPSKRLITALKGIANYDKKKDGNAVVREVSIPTLKKKCRHFGEWMDKLEKMPTLKQK